MVSRLRDLESRGSGFGVFRLCGLFWFAVEQHASDSVLR